MFTVLGKVIPLYKMYLILSKAIQNNKPTLC